MSLDWSAVGSIGTAVAVLIAAWQVRKSTQQAQTDFEDDLAREYRELTRSMPVEALLGAELSDEQFDAAFSSLYRYLDLSNQQTFLRMTGRVRRSTWSDWCEGIQSNLSRPAFERAWQSVKRRSTNFHELRRLESSSFADDPRRWFDWKQRVRQWVSA
jgi:hypothetical protein